MLVIAALLACVFGLKLHTRLVDGIHERFSNLEAFSEGPSLYAFQFKEGLSMDLRKKLRKDLAILHDLGYVGPDQYVAKLTPDEVHILLPHVKDMDTFYEEDKTFLTFPKHLDNEDLLKSVTLVVQLYNSDPSLSDFSDITEKYEKIDAKLRGNYLHLEGMTDRNAVRWILDYLKKHEDVVWIEREIPPKTMNYGINTVFQDKKVSGTEPFKLWEEGITGEGQIVTVMDTGLQYSNHFFHDVQAVGPLNRKVISYENTATGQNLCDGGTTKKCDENGHGTHVAGTVAGNTDDSTLGRFNGVAKNAKLAIQTFGTGADTYLSLKKSYDLGSRIHTNSWGVGYSSYVGTCTWDCSTGIDKCTGKTDSECTGLYGVAKCCTLGNRYNNDMVVLSAAGNDGKAGSEKMVGSPGTSKNGICVGASTNTLDSWNDGAAYSSLQTGIDELIPEYLTFAQVDNCCPTAYPHICCKANREGTYAGDVKYREDYLAKFSSPGPTFDGRIGVDLTGPGHYVISAKSNKKTANNVKYSEYDNRGTHTPFSTQTEVDDGNTVVELQGTSMATPGMAGLTALLRQYFVDGYYPNGTKSAAQKYDPSGMLLKAIMVTSADPTLLKKYIDGGDTLHDLATDFPSKIMNRRVGFGIPKLQSTLILKNVNTPADYVLDFSDRMFTAHGKRDVMINGSCFHPTSATNTFKATMVFYDKPGTALSTSVVVNDLNLEAKIYSSFSSPASGALVTTEVANGKTVGSEDALNSVEKILLVDTVTTSQYVCVSVHGKSVVSGEFQSHAVVVSATNFEKVDVDFQCNSKSRYDPTACTGIENICIGQGVCALSSLSDASGGCVSPLVAVGNECECPPPVDLVKSYTSKIVSGKLTCVVTCTMGFEEVDNECVCPDGYSWGDAANECVPVADRAVGVIISLFALLLVFVCV